MIRFDNLIFFNGYDFTEPKTLVIKDDIFNWIGDVKKLPIQYCDSDIQIDANGLLAIPSFTDSHIHFLGLAANLNGNKLDLSDNAGLPEFITQLKEISKSDPHSQWLRIYGLDPFHPILEKFISKDIIDSCISNRPVIIRFSSGHGVLLNSVAMKQLGITDSTDETKAMTFVRSIETGKLTGVFYEIETLLNDSVPLISNEIIIKGVKDANDLLLSKGFTSIMDATVENDLPRLFFLADLYEKEIITLDVSFMLGYEYLEDFVKSDITYGSNFRGIHIGPVKLMTSLSSGNPYPNKKTLTNKIKHCHSLGFPVAIHIVEKEMASLAADILAEYYVKGDRLEHLTELDDNILNKLSHNNVFVSVNPSFIYEYGDRYVRKLKSTELKYIYRFKSMLENNLVLGFGSDAPLTIPSGLRFIDSVTKRLTKNSIALSPSEKLTIAQAINIATSGTPFLSSTSKAFEKINIGSIANMTLINSKFMLENTNYSEDKVALTIHKGKIVYSNL